MNQAIRSELRRKFDDDELKEVAIAAMRRIRVKRERQTELAERFVRELPKRIH
jgi:hypothetical protein